VREVAELIFKQNFSTKTDISTISGRGVGMDAVLHAALEMGGRIDIELTSPEKSMEEIKTMNSFSAPCRFLITLPKHVYI
jgi:hypothetical protein